MKSVSKDAAAAALKIIEKMLNNVFKDRDLNHYCFSGEYLEKIENLIFEDI